VWWAPAYYLMILTSYLPPSIPRKNLLGFHDWLSSISKEYRAWNIYFWVLIIAWFIWAVLLVYWN